MSVNEIRKSLAYKKIHGSVFDPQWISHRFHRESNQLIKQFEHVAILELGSGDSELSNLVPPSSIHVTLDYPATNEWYRSSPKVYGDARELPFLSESLDVVVLYEVLEHVDGEEKVIAEIYRVLKPNGVLLFSVPFLYPEHDVPADYKRYTVFGLEKILAGKFKVSRCDKSGNSFVTCCYLMNFTLLESVKVLFRKNGLLGLILAVLIYPLCVINNLLSVPLSLFKQVNSAYLGARVCARKIDEQ